MATYDTYTSLGNNCEVAFQIRRVLGHDSSSFFSWNVTSFHALISLLQSRFVGILDLPNLTNEPEKGLMHDSSHDFRLHTPFKLVDLHAEENLGSRLYELKSKFRYLVDKFVSDASDAKRTVYFYKTEEKSTVRDNARRVHGLLKALAPGCEFSLVIIMPLSEREAQWDDQGIFNRYLRRIAPWEDATDGHVASWDRIFREFPHKDGLRLAGY